MRAAAENGRLAAEIKSLKEDKDIMADVILDAEQQKKVRAWGLGLRLTCWRLMVYDTDGDLGWGWGVELGMRHHGRAAEEGTGWVG